MHEMSLVRALLQQAQAIAWEHGGLAIAEIRVSMGPLSGVEPQLVASAFEMLAPSRPATAAARLSIDTVPLTARCGACNATFEVQRFRFICPACSSSAVRVLQGDAMILESVTLTQPAIEGSLS